MNHQLNYYSTVHENQNLVSKLINLIKYKEKHKKISILVLK